MKRILLTGGGTAGHVTPNLALLPSLKQMDYDIHYMGSFDGIEKKLIADYDIPYYGIATGKLRRYFSLRNFTDPFRVIQGFNEAKKIIKKIQPDVVFSKGGFVSVPVVRAAASLGIPCIIHESDMTPGLANKLCIPKAYKICCNFPETLQCLPSDKAVLTGSPIREELAHGNKIAGLNLCGFDSSKPIIMVVGGSTGARAINTTVRKALPELLKDFQIVHLCGAGNVDNLLWNQTGYKQFEYVKSEMKDLFAITDLVISRAGANSICEILALKKPNLLIPLPLASSRGDQIQNAKSFESQGFSIVLDEDDLDETLLTDNVHELYFNRQKYINAMLKSNQTDSIRTIMNILEQATSSKK